jgi:hypothetical protein
MDEIGQLLLGQNMPILMVRVWRYSRVNSDEVSQNILEMIMVLDGIGFLFQKEWI